MILLGKAGEGDREAVEGAGPRAVRAVAPSTTQRVVPLPHVATLVGEDQMRLRTASAKRA